MTNFSIQGQCSVLVQLHGPPGSGHPASPVSFSWQEDSKAPVGDCSPTAHPHQAQALPAGAQGQYGCSVQAVTQAALGVTVLRHPEQQMAPHPTAAFHQAFTANRALH